MKEQWPEGTTYVAADRIPVRMTLEEWHGLCRRYSDSTTERFHRFDVFIGHAFVPDWDVCTVITVTIPAPLSYGKDRVKHFGPHYNDQRTCDKARIFLIEQGVLEIIPECKPITAASLTVREPLDVTPEQLSEMAARALTGDSTA